MMSGTLPLSGLKRLLRTPTAALVGERCDRCGAELPTDHRHVADVESRSLRCVCAVCHDALSGAGAGGDQRPVPRRYLQLPSGAISEEEWDSFEIPVGIAFFFHNSALGRIVASYPSPAGATESLLEPAAWESVIRASPRIATLEPDVEALLVRRTMEVSESFLVPIDSCYELAGRIRRGWSGFGGGPDVRAEVESFFEMLRRFSEQIQE